MGGRECSARGGAAVVRRSPWRTQKVPKGLLKIMLMGSIGLFLGAAIAGYVFSM